MTDYPTLRIGVLQSLMELKGRIEQDSNFLKLESCPYDNETVGVLDHIFAPIERIVEIEKLIEVGSLRRPRPKDMKLSEEDQSQVETTARDLLSQLNSLGEGEKGLDTQTKIQIIKTKATLIEQLLKLRERWFNVKRTAEFQEVVIAILDDLIADRDRDEFLRRIDPYRE